MKLREVYNMIKNEGWEKTYIRLTKNIPEEKRCLLDGIVYSWDAFCIAIENKLEGGKTIGAAALERLEKKKETDREYYYKGLFAGTLTSVFSGFFALGIPQALFGVFEGCRAAYRNFKEKFL